ncbi:MAG: Gfo/Idh/MocA family oxidoreductase, partial [Bacteroidota bacterium]
WFSELPKSGGALFDLHVHDIDCVRYLLGEPNRLSSVGHKRDDLAYTDIHSTLQFEDGIYATAYASYDFPRAMPFRMGYRALFERGYIDYDTWRQPTLRHYGEMKEQPVDLRDLPSGYEAECDYFARCVVEGKPPALSTAESSSKTIFLLECISESADQFGKWIDV